MVDHALQLEANERANMHPDQAPTQADQEGVASQLRAFVDECRTRSRESYRCAMAARSMSELVACQPTPSSSTSNSSVAPGGITPPAPVAP